MNLAPSGRGRSEPSALGGIWEMVAWSSQKSSPKKSMAQRTGGTQGKHHFSHIFDVWFMNIRYDMCCFLQISTIALVAVPNPIFFVVTSCLSQACLAFQIHMANSTPTMNHQVVHCTHFCCSDGFLIHIPSAVFLAPAMKAGNEPPISEEWKTYKIVIHPPNPKSSSVVPLLVLHLPGEGL
jgi:hypothetical protein